MGKEIFYIAIVACFFYAQIIFSSQDKIRQLEGFKKESFQYASLGCLAFMTGVMPGLICTDYSDLGSVARLTMGVGVFGLFSGRIIYMHHQRYKAVANQLYSYKQQKSLLV